MRSLRSTRDHGNTEFRSALLHRGDLSQNGLTVRRLQFLWRPDNVVQRSGPVGPPERLSRGAIRKSRGLQRRDGVARSEHHECGRVATGEVGEDDVAAGQRAGRDPARRGVHSCALAQLTFCGAGVGVPTSSWMAS